MQEYPTLAAVDLGSNSFHLQVGRVEGEQLFYLDAHKESVRLAAGLNGDKRLDAASQKRALDCLARFGERLKGMPAGSVRAVGTSALRVAKNSAEFMEQAKAALGFDIEVVSGREEARLIYLGVAHSLPLNKEPRLVVDIGGGSTECIIGIGYEPQERESLRMGCVVFSEHYFPEGRVDKAAMKAAVTAARMETQEVAKQFKRGRWVEAVGSSGTARALGELCFQMGLSDGEITVDGLKWLRESIAKAGGVEQADMPGLKPDRRPVILGGIAVMSAIFEELKIETMKVAQGAMREGILWDLLGRVHDHDMRDVTVAQFVRRYHVDTRQAQRVERLALSLFAPWRNADMPDAAHFLGWAARLHEIGISIAHSGFHKHSAYILENADMPGFSRQDQVRLAMLVRASRGGMAKLDIASDYPDWPLILCLRLAVLLHRNRSDAALPNMRLDCAEGECILRLPDDWLAGNPLSQAAIEGEIKQWRGVPAELRLAGLRGR